MTIEQRVAKLESQNRWIKRGGGLALAAVACVVLMGQGKGKELPDLVAKSLTIKSAVNEAKVFIGGSDSDRGALLVIEPRLTSAIRWRSVGRG